ncbi:MAG: ParB/RepB/Spo0J family partition protein [Clostridia bacterium]|nr:ParB/RepB/Spo0J family partition protein [Clostridia bacterium]
MSYTLKPKLLLLKPQKIVCSINAIRKHYSDYEIKNLADNISAVGIIEPLVVIENNTGNYELVSGYKRLKAALFLGLRRVPCTLIDAKSEDIAFISLSENINRTSLNFFEEAESIKQIITYFNITNSVAAQKLGIPISVLLSKLTLLKLDENSKERIINGGLSERHAKVVLLIPENKREEFLDRIIKEELNVAKTKELAEKILLYGDTPPSETAEEKFEEIKPFRKSAIGDARLFANSLTKLIETMKSSGVEAISKRTETDKHVEYKVRIMKPTAENYSQLKLV